jgi:hypothetical protein
MQEISLNAVDKNEIAFILTKAVVSCIMVVKWRDIL